MLDRQSPDLLQRTPNIATPRAVVEREESPNRERHDGVNTQTLRHVTDLEAARAPDLATLAADQPEQGAHKRCLSGAIGPD
jgi:hypothetical protein